jgi:NADH dehydrogenase FAD-containing subunit
VLLEAGPHVLSNFSAALSAKVRTVLWAAGVAASPLARTLGVPLDRAGCVCVDTDLSVPGYPDIFFAGDLATITSDSTPAPGVAPAAKQMGMHVARMIRARLAGHHRFPQPAGGADRLGVGVLELPAQCADYRRRHEQTLRGL